MEPQIGRLDVRNGLRGGLCWGAFAVGVMMVLVVWEFGFGRLTNFESLEEFLYALPHLAARAKWAILVALSIGACSGWVSHAVHPRLSIVWSIVGILTISAVLWFCTFVVLALIVPPTPPGPMPRFSSSPPQPLITPFELLFVSGPPLVATYFLTRIRLY